VDKTRAKPARTGLVSWGALLGLSLMSMQAPALVTGHLESGSQLEAVQELVEKLGYTESGPSCLFYLLHGPGGHKWGFVALYRAECHGEKLFLKFADQPAAQAFLPAIRLLESSPLLSTSILQPIAEFSVGIQRGGSRPDRQVYCSAYPWIPGDTLLDVLHKLREPEQEAEYLTGIYRQLGRLLGEMHGAGLVDADKPLEEMQSRLIHRDIGSINLKITPDNRIVILDIDSFTDPEAPLSVKLQPLSVKWFAVKDFMWLVIWPEPEHNFLIDSPIVSAWLRVLPGIAEALLSSYCQALVGQDKAAACVSEIAEHAAWIVGGSHEANMRNARQKESQPFVSREEMARRLEMVFGPLRKHSLE